MFPRSLPVSLMLFLLGAGLCLGAGESGIVLSGDEVETVVCRSQNETIVIALLRLHFKNTSSEPMVINRFWSDARIKISDPSEDGATVVDVRLRPGRDEPTLADKRDPRALPPERFFFDVLPPGRSSDLDLADHLTFVAGRSLHKRLSDFGPPGKNYRLQLEVRPDRADAETIASLRMAWKSFGSLFVQNLTSEPITIHPSTAHAARHCNSWSSIGLDGP